MRMIKSMLCMYQPNKLRLVEVVMVICTKGGWWTQGSKACNSGAEQQWCRVSTFGAKYLWHRAPMVQSMQSRDGAE